MPTVTPQALTRTVQDFLSEAAGAVVLENGAVAFDLAQSKYSISGEYNRCLLHLWSAERNAVRRVLEAGGQERHTAAGGAAAGTGAALEAGDLPRARPAYSNGSTRGPRRVRAKAAQDAGTSLSRVQDHEADERRGSGEIFWASYTRGLMRQGRSAFAVLGVNGQETQSSIDAALTFGILWLDVCRKAQASECSGRGSEDVCSGRNVRRWCGNGWRT